jgi:hypothetical protein
MNLLETACGWAILHIKFVSINFYMILFDEREHIQAANKAHPWLYMHEFMYVFAWELDFDVSTGNT